VADDNFTLFSQGVPKELSNSDTKDLFNALRAGLNLKETKDFKMKLEFKETTKEREDYINGSLDDYINKIVYLKENNKPVILKHLGSNYVIIESDDGNKKRLWIEDISINRKAYPWGRIKKIKGYKHEKI